MQKRKAQKRLSRPKHVLSVKKGSMVMTYDKEADAAYFRIKKGKVARTVELQEWLLTDVDEKGALLGIEMLFVSSHLPKRSIASAFKAGRIPVAV